jgi:Uma2 family endonuclease
VYQRNRVHEYWIVDLRARVPERWRPLDVAPEILRDADAFVWSPAGSTEPLVLRLHELFDAARVREGDDV